MIRQDNKTIMIVGAGEEHIFAQNVAREMGLRAFVTDGNREAPGMKTADFCAVASTYDCVKTLAVARDYEKTNGKISGVMTLASDVPYTVAFVASHLGLVGIPLETARLLSDKILMKQAFKKAQVSIPAFQDALNAEEIKTFAQMIGYPVVVKPVDSRGARGVQMVKGSEPLVQVWETAQKESPSGRVMVEEYLEGPQLSVEGAMIDGKAYLPAIFDRNYEFIERFTPFIVENGGEMPSRYSKTYKDEVEAVVGDAASAVGLRDGVIKGDLVIHQGRVKVIEIAGRLSGGFFGTVATPYSTGVDPVKNVLRWSLGEKVLPKDWMAKTELGACIRFSFPEPGRVQYIASDEDVRADKTCLYTKIFVGSGDMILPIRSHPNRPAVVVAKGTNRLQSVENAIRLINKIKIQVDSSV